MSLSPSRSYRAMDGSMVTEGPGFRESTYHSPDGTEYRHESHREGPGTEEYTYESHKTSPSRGGGGMSFPSHSPRGGLYSAMHSAYLPPPASSMDMGRLSPRSPFFESGYGGGALSHHSSSSMVGGGGFSSSPRYEADRLLADADAQVARIRAEADATLDRARREADAALDQARRDAEMRSISPRHSPSYAPPPAAISPSRYSPGGTYHSPSRYTSTTTHSPSRYSGGYHSPSHLSPARAPLPLGGGETEEYEEYTHTVTTTTY